MLYTPRGFPPSYLASCLSLTITHYHSLFFLSLLNETENEEEEKEGKEGRKKCTQGRGATTALLAQAVSLSASVQPWHALAAIANGAKGASRSQHLLFSSSFENISLWKCFGNFQKTDCCPFKEGERERKDFLLPN